MLCGRARRGWHAPREAEPQREEVAEGDAEAGHEAGAGRLAGHHQKVEERESAPYLHSNRACTYKLYTPAHPAGLRGRGPPRCPAMEGALAEEHFEHCRWHSAEPEVIARCRSCSSSPSLTFSRARRATRTSSSARRRSRTCQRRHSPPRRSSSSSPPCRSQPPGCVVLGLLLPHNRAHMCLGAVNGGVGWWQMPKTLRGACSCLAYAHLPKMTPGQDATGM